MKNTTIKFITLTFITSLIVSAYFTVINASGADLTVKPLIGRAPVIDGEIDTSSNEWNKAVKKQLKLYPNISEPTTYLPVDLWVMQNGTVKDMDLYISVQFSLEYHSETEFVGLLISRNESEISEDFKDAKIIQFSNISNNEFNYLDYHIKNLIYYEDLDSNGNGAATLEDKKVIYEFSLPVEVAENETEDVYLDYGEPGHTFKIIFGETPIYPDGIMISNFVLIQVTFPFPDHPTTLELLYLILSITIFSTIGALYAFYIYRIIKLKERIERIRT